MLKKIDPRSGHEGKKAEDIIHMNWLNMARAGLMGLEFYTPETGKWRQAHMCARYVILRVMLEAGEGFVSIEQFTSADGKPDLVVRLDASKIETTGKKCIGDFLLKLQVYKSYGDVERGFFFFLGGGNFSAHADGTHLRARSHRRAPSERSR